MSQSADAPQGLAKYIPLLQWLPIYNSAWLSRDIVAGLAAAAVVIPQAMAYATIAGLPVQYGLYAALTPMVIYALLGTSRVLSVSVTSTISILTASTLLAAVGNSDSEAYLTAAVTLAALVGIFLILAGLLRLGILANLISLPVLTGFKAGVGVVIFVGQIAKVLGLSIDKAPLLETLSALVQNLGNIHWATFAVAVATLAILISLPRITRRVPAALVAVILGIGASALFNFEAAGIGVVGTVPSGLPVLSLPDLTLIGLLWPGALGIALMCFIESIAAARAFAQKDEPPIDANQELLALGLANLGGSFLQAYPGGGGTSQTAVNRESGAKTQVAALVTAGMVALTLLFLAPLIAFMPQATLGAMVMVAAAGLINVREFRAIRTIRSTEFWWAMIAFVGVMLLGTLEGILVAVLVSILTLLYQTSLPPIYQLGRKPGTDVFRPLSEDHPDDETFPDLLLLRTEGRMFFASAPNLTDKIWALIDANDPQIVVIDFDAVPDLEYTALKLLGDFEEQLAEQGRTLWLAALNPEPMRVISRAPLGQVLTENRLFWNVEQAVEAYQAQ